MTATKLTSAEFDAIETILANGGKVIAHMGRKRKGAVNKRLLLDMQDRGLVRMIGSGSDYYLRSGPARVNVEVRAAGCVAFNAEQGRRALKDDPTTADLLRRRNPSDTPKIYVANLAAYNAGRLKGKWIEPSTNAEELSEQIVEAIGGNPDHEWAFHDYDGFPDMGENPSLEDVAMMAELLEEHPYHIVKAAQGFAGNDMDALKEWLDEGYGTYESKRDYVEQYIDDMGGPSALGKDAIDRYFDYEAFGHDLSIDADEEDRERYEGMSDQEIGEEAINDFYGDEIPKDLADRYFDFDSYARDVFYEVASVRVPGEGLVVFNKR